MNREAMSPRRSAEYLRAVERVGDYELKSSNRATLQVLSEGLAGKADGYGGPADGVIETKELGAYIIDRVKTLTRGEQHATHAQPAELPSFPFVRVR